MIRITVSANDIRSFFQARRKALHRFRNRAASLNAEIRPNCLANDLELSKRQADRVPPRLSFNEVGPGFLDRLRSNNELLVRA